jgi:hypothetical protein
MVDVALLSSNRLLVWVAGCLCVGALTESSWAGEHPRLLFGLDDVPKLRQKITREPFQEMFQHLQKIADYGHRGEPITEYGDFDRQIIAHRRAFLYVLTGDDSHAKAAREQVEHLLKDSRWANPRTKGLTLYTQGLYVALAYDYCFGAPSWDAEFSAKVSKDLLRQHEVIVKSGGSEQNRSPASNWQGLRAAAAGITSLATDEEVDAKGLEWAHGRMQGYLTANIGSGREVRGWNCEGLGYTYYPFGNGIAQYVLAARRKDPKFDLTTHQGMRMALWTTYAALVKTPHGLVRPDFGDDNPGTDGEGCYGFAFALCPPELVPGLKYWYDRTVGVQGNRCFDDVRFGVAASILYYPDEVAEADPMTLPLWRESFVDTAGNGFMTYRNQYRDETDVVGQFYVKLRGNRGHSGPDALSFRIAGLGTLWVTGGGRYGVKHNGQDTYLRSMSTLYPVDPDERLAISGQSGKILGTPLIREDGSGHVVASILQNNVGTKNHTRRFLTSFNSGAQAAFVIADTSEDGRFWQLATLAHNQITTEGATFTVTTPSGPTMKGTVLYPADPKFKTGTRPRGSKALGFDNNQFIHFETPDGCALVVLTLADKGAAHPAVQATGTWSGQPAGEVTVGTFKARVDGDQVVYP